MKLFRALRQPKLRPSSRGSYEVLWQQQISRPFAASITYERGDRFGRHQNSRTLRPQNQATTQKYSSRKDALAAIDLFKTQVRDGTATLEGAVSCMETTQAYARTLPTEKARPECANLEIGSHVMNWFWTYKSPQGEEEQIDRNFSELLCCFLVPEGRKEYIWNWLEIVSKAADGSRLPPSAQGRNVDFPWRGKLLAGLGNAHLAWASDGSPNNALRIFRDAHRRFAKHQAAVSFVSIGVGIDRFLKTSHVPPADEALFMMFYHAMATWNTPNACARVQALLMLYHPSDADAIAVCRLFRERHPFFGEELFDRVSSAAATKFGIFLLRAAYILRLQNHADDATWLESIVQSRSPGAWNLREREFRMFQSDPKLNKLRADKHLGNKIT